VDAQDLKAQLEIVEHVAKRVTREKMEFPDLLESVEIEAQTE